MSAVEVVSDSRGHVGDDPDTHEFRPLSEEEKQHFVNFDAAKSTPPFVGEADQATNSTEENEVLAGRELVVLPPNGQPLAPLMESFPIQNLEFTPNQVATSRYGQDRGVMLQFIFPLLVSVVAFLLVLRFYPALHSSLPAISDQTDQQLAASSPLPILTTTSDS